MNYHKLYQHEDQTSVSDFDVFDTIHYTESQYKTSPVDPVANTITAPNTYLQPNRRYYRQNYHEQYYGPGSLKYASLYHYQRTY